MKRHLLRIVAGAMLLGNFVIFSATGCAHEHAEGPMERAGRHTDNAAHDVKKGAEKAADDVSN